MDIPRIQALFPQLFANGWSPIPNADKRCFIKERNKLVIDAKQCRLWARQRRWPAIGLRIEAPLVVVDCDVLDQGLMAQMRRMLGVIAPDILAGLERIGHPPKVAFFLRYADALGPFGKRNSRTWSFAPDNAEAPKYRIEIYGGRSGQQFGSFGPHSHDKATGAVLRTYRWAGRSPADTRLDALPEIGRDATFAICDEADKIFKATPGLKPVKGTHCGESVRQVAYDLTEATLFETADGETDLAGLADALKSLTVTGGPRLRCSGSFTGDAHSAGSLRCLVSFGHDDNVVVYDTKTNISHRLAGSEAPYFDERFVDLFANLQGD